MTPSAGELLRVLRDLGLQEIQALAPAEGGESGSAFRATDRSGKVSIVKVLPATGADAASQLRDLDTTVRRLRERGYPAPRLRDFGYADGMLFWVQELLPGSPLDPGTGMPGLAAVARLLPSLITLNNAQAGLGTGARRLGDLVRTTLAVGGDGYCLHATLERDPRTRGLLALLRNAGERYGGDIPDQGDYVHYDFTPANLLSDGAAVTGVIDVNPPVITGDRAFDLATLLFYSYDHGVLREALRARLLRLAAPGVAAAYLAHMVLRQVEWSLRHYPGAAGTERHLRLAELVVADFPQRPRG
jgi:Ser/Thr protein kinase RdoA (MazF antagonist)